MRCFKHNSGAMVCVDNNGKKTITKYDYEFNSFVELKAFEKQMNSKGVDLKKQALEDTKKMYREYRQK